MPFCNPKRSRLHQRIQLGITILFGLLGFVWLSQSEFFRERKQEKEPLSLSTHILLYFFICLLLHLCLSSINSLSLSLCFFFSLFGAFILPCTLFLGDIMKKMKRVRMESSPSYVFDEEAKNRFKLQSLMQDFSELEKETEEMKKRLGKAKRKRLILLAEVRFLRRRYKYLMENPSLKIPSECSAKPKFPNARKQSSLKGRNNKEKEASTRGPPAIDLNQRGEETEEFVWEPPRIEKKLERSSLEGNGLASDLKLVCRDVGNGSSRSGKKKISWQDQVALRV